ncbi:MAG: ATP-binding protein [Candidatus Thermoplasmatota archaeon]|nr:ATP-binding protein [Candidatus Thermoplasmatota archaeon]
MMTSNDVLEDIVEEWRNIIQKERVIHRDVADDVEKSLGMEEISVVKGVRRAGKTFILYELFKKQEGIYLNFEDERLYDFTLPDFEKIADIAMEHQKKILYLDEVQEVPGWEKFAHRAHRRFKIFVTGSNSKLLSSEYASALVGRTKSFTILPLSYPEFLRFKNMELSRNSFMKYLHTGGFPRIVLTGDISLIHEYFERIIYRDIISRARIKYPDALKTVALYLLSNMGKEFSYRSLKAISGIRHENTLKEYIGLLKDAFLLDVLSRYSPSLKAQSSYSKKAYAVDTAFITLGKRKGEDTGRILENMVYLHLKIKKDIYFLKNAKEIDFIVCRGLQPIKLVNVSYEAEKKETINREVDSLLYFGKMYKVPLELVSVYPVHVPQGISSHLAHRYLCK